MIKNAKPLDGIKIAHSLHEFTPVPGTNIHDPINLKENSTINPDQNDDVGNGFDYSLFDSTCDVMDFDYMKILYEVPELSDIFRTNLNCFKNLKVPYVNGNINLWLLFQKIKNGFLLRTPVSTMLMPKYINGERNAIYDKLKETLPGVCYNATFNNYRDTTHISAVTNLMFLDIDDFSSKDETEMYKETIIKKYDWIVAVSKSLSRIGLHLIIQVDHIVDNVDFNNKYEYINTNYFDGKLDKSSKSLSRFTVMPTDYNIYINKNPATLEINRIFNDNEKSISSVRPYYIETNNTLNGYEKSIWSEHKERKIICTPYTFSTNTNSLENIVNSAARKNHLIFRTVIDESKFVNPNKPLYWADGIDYVEVNLCPYKNQKVLVGNRNKTIGAIGIQMIYLNAKNVSKREIENFMVNLNKKICAPPLEDQEVRNSFHANWKMYENGKLNFNGFIKKKYVFWSPRCKLSANEKRKISCLLRQEPTREKTRELIDDAINSIWGKCERVTQKKIAKTSGLNVQTVKNYWHEYKLKVRDINDELKLDDSVKYDSYR